MNVVIAGDIHLDSETTGRVKGGIPIRVLDTYKSLDQIVNYCNENNVEEVHLTGDYYRTNHPSQMYKAMFHKFIMNLVDLNIKVTILEGNHDKSRSAIGKSAVSEFKTLPVKGVYLVDEAQLLHFDDYDLACVPWQYHNELPDFNLTRQTLAIAHCTTWGWDQVPNWESDELGRDFKIDLDYFMQFDFTVLGHIHKNMILNDDPTVLYPGSAERHTWGEWGDMSFVHITDDNWRFIPYKLRPKYDLRNEIPDKIDPEGMYRLTTEDFDMSSADIHNAFSDAFSFRLKEIRKRPQRQFRVVEEIAEMTPTQQLKVYFDEIAEDFSEVEELWQTLYQ